MHIKSMIFVNMISIFVIMPSIRQGLPIMKSQTSIDQVQENDLLNAYEHTDKSKGPEHKTFMQDGNKDRDVVFISGNNFRDTSNAFNKMIPQNESVKENSGFRKMNNLSNFVNITQIGKNINKTDSSVFTYYVRVVKGNTAVDLQGKIHNSHPDRNLTDLDFDGESPQNTKDKERPKKTVDKMSIKSGNGWINYPNKQVGDTIINKDYSVTHESEPNVAVPTDDPEVAKDGSLRYPRSSGEQLEEPTSRIVVTVMKRSERYWEPWELNQNVCPPSLCTASEENRPKGTGDSNILSNILITRNHPYLRHHPGGSVFFNGDIVLDAESERQIYGNSLRIRWKRAATRDSKKLWKDGIVPYTFSDVLPSSKRYIKKAIAQIEKHTCIRFRRKKLRDEDFIRFISEPGCWSNVGRVGGEQKVSIGRGCDKLGTAVHEIAHALGFWHEQARPDRDKYVKVLEENVSPRYLPDFDPVNKTLVGSRGFPYDYESVMHYSKKAFTNLGEDTIKVIGIGQKLNMTIGQRDELSNLDIAQLRDMYKCNDKEDDDVTFCPSGWTKKDRSCYKFITELRYQFAAAARHCEELNSHLLYIENKREDKYIKKTLKKKYLNVAIWRTGGKKFKKEFAWYTGDNKTPKKMDYTKWKSGHPAGYSSMALVHNNTANRVRWEGVWLGSASQYPRHAYPFICERRARRKCIKGKFSDGRDYRGKLDHTIDGVTCQKWSAQYPHSHKLLPYPYKNTKKENPDGLGDHNYCRNPSKERKRRPWCFTDKSRIKWDYCDISICSGSSGDKEPAKQSNSNKNRKNDSNKLTTKNKFDNKKDAYSSNKIDTDKKKSNRGQNKNNEIQRDQGDKKREKTQVSGGSRTTNASQGANKNNKNSNSKRNTNSKERHSGRHSRISNRQNRRVGNSKRDRRKESRKQSEKHRKRNPKNENNRNKRTSLSV